MRIAISAVAVAGLLAGCGAGKKPTDEEPVEIDYSKLEITRPSTEALVLADEEALDIHIKNGLRLATTMAYGGSSSSGGHAGGGGSSSSSTSSSGGFPSSSSSSSSSASSSSGMMPDPNSPPEDASGDSDWSDTNVHVSGVDESDFAKYDGQYWFVATSEIVTGEYTRTGSPGFQIIAPDPGTPNAEILGKFELDDPWGVIGEMYLVGDAEATSHVVLLREQAGNVRPSFPSWQLPFDSMGGVAGYYGPRNGALRLQLVNVEDPQAPAEDFDIKLDGTLIDSRKIGDVIYLVTRFEPWVEDLRIDYGDAKVRKDNEQALAAKPLSDLLPHYQLGDAARLPLSDKCYVQEGLSETSGFSSLVHITAIDLREQKLLASRCVNSSVTSISMSLESLYLTGVVPDAVYWNNGETVIHKFSLDEEDGLEYEATGSVTGTIQGNGDPAFRLHEYEDDLRVVTTQWTSGPEHSLFILRQNGNSLDQIARLPNSERPEALGKPGEDIYSVRFEDDRAFIVTFRRTDPLYMIDLTDPLDPFVAGELEIPGFATYMHPLNSQYLFTLGQDASESGVVRGIKAELIDVSEGDPVSVASLVFGNSGSTSEALHNLRALNLLKVSESEWHIAFPLQHYEWNYVGDDANYREQFRNGLQMLEITGLDGDAAELEDAGFLLAEYADSSVYPSLVSRGLLQGDAAFYAHKNAVWATPWGDVNAAIGPITRGPEGCTTSVNYGVEIKLSVPEESGLNACDAVVTITDRDYVETLLPQEKASNGTSCTFEGASERPGYYAIAATLEGMDPIYDYAAVWTDECHVQTERRELKFQECGYMVPAVEVTVFSDQWLDCNGTVSVFQDDVEYPLEFYGSSSSSGFPGPGSSGGFYDDWSGSSSAASSSGATRAPEISSSSSSSGFWGGSSSSGIVSSSSSSGSFSSTTSSSSTSTSTSTSGWPQGSGCYYAGARDLTGEVSLVVEMDGYKPYREDGIVIPEKSCQVNAVQYREVFLQPEL